MNLGILKFIGLGAIGIGGVGTAIVFGSDKVSKFVGLSSSSPTPSTSSLPSASEADLNEVDIQYQFLYKLAKKLFEAVSKLPTSPANDRENVIKWLKDKFSNYSVDETDKWENFKALCEEQKKKEIKSGDEMVNEHARLCFVDAGANPKGALGKWYGKDNLQIPQEIQIDFVDFHKKNYDLWNEFKSKHPSSNFLSEFDKWYEESQAPDLDEDEEITLGSSSSTGIGLFKAVVNRILQSSSDVEESGS